MDDDRGWIWAGCGVLVLGLLIGLGRRNSADPTIRTYACTECGKLSQRAITAPPNPCCPQASNVPVEWCGWTPEGTPATEATAVILNTYRHEAEPTFCPRCQRLVRGHNPPAIHGMAPPPTRQQWEER